MLLLVESIGRNNIMAFDIDE